MNQETLNISPPNRNIQYESALSRGNATSRAPICSGMTKLKNAALIGMITRKIMIRPCMVKNWLKVPPSIKSFSGTASWVRMATASPPPTSEKKSAVKR